MKEIPLFRRRKIAAYAIVDDSDFEEISRCRWLLLAVGYAAMGSSVRIRPGKWKNSYIYLHRQIAGTPKGMYTDHIDGNKLNNQKANLRICLGGENLFNRGASKCNKTGYKGVHFSKRDKRYIAQIKAYGVHKCLGYFKTAQEAGAAYDSAAKKLHGEFYNSGAGV